MSDSVKNTKKKSEIIPKMALKVDEAVGEWMLIDGFLLLGPIYDITLAHFRSNIERGERLFSLN